VRAAPAVLQRSLLSAGSGLSMGRPPHSEVPRTKMLQNKKTGSGSGGPKSFVFVGRFRKKVTE
jgi:hypothetical protein